MMVGPKFQMRDPVTKQFAYENNWDRLCVCGHTLGIHIAGGFECCDKNSGGDHCECQKFRPSKRKVKP